MAKLTDSSTADRDSMATTLSFDSIPSTKAAYWEVESKLKRIICTDGMVLAMVLSS